MRSTSRTIVAVCSSEHQRTPQLAWTGRMPMTCCAMSSPCWNACGTVGVPGATAAGRGRRGAVPRHGGHRPGRPGVRPPPRCREASAPDTSRYWAAGLARALEQMHRRRIIHGDVKPANISHRSTQARFDFSTSIWLTTSTGHVRRAAPGPWGTGRRSGHCSSRLNPWTTSGHLAPRCWLRSPGCRCHWCPTRRCLPNYQRPRSRPGRPPALRAAITGCLESPHP